MDANLGKIAAGKLAASLIQHNQLVGLGTGSTAACFIDALIERCKNGLSIQAVSSSTSSAKRAQDGGIKVLDMHEISHIDVTVDGADEIDYQKRMIKGGGGAHVKEKILASSSDRMIVIVDETKVVKQLGQTKLPIEIVRFGSNFTEGKIRKLGFKTSFRFKNPNELFISENENYILDIFFEKPLLEPEKLHNELLQIPGVVDTGFFFNIANLVIVGKTDGTTFNI